MKHTILILISLSLFLFGWYFENNYLTSSGFSILFLYSFRQDAELKEQKEATETYKKTAIELREIYNDLQTGKL